MSLTPASPPLEVRLAYEILIYVLRIKSKSPTLVRCSMGSVVGTVAAKVHSIFEKNKLLTK